MTPVGMFDHLRCDLPLPDGYDVADFQTKSLECLLDSYRITAAGGLEVKRSAWMHGLPEEPAWEPLPDFHGDVVFYDYDDRGLPPAGPYLEERWHEYRARYDHGRLESLTTAPGEAP